MVKTTFVWSRAIFSWICREMYYNFASNKSTGNALLVFKQRRNSPIQCNINVTSRSEAESG